jgi:hypothetical protein
MVVDRVILWYIVSLRDGPGKAAVHCLTLDLVTGKLHCMKL